jgi:hypothetical protein
MIYKVSHYENNKILEDIVRKFNNKEYMSYQTLVLTRRIIEQITHKHEGTGSIFDN